MADEDKDSKTEDPTEKRLRKARDEGNVPISQEIKSLITLIAVLVIVGLMAPFIIRRLGQLLGAFLGHVDRIPTDLEGLRAALLGLLQQVGIVLAMPIGMMVILAIAGGVMQAGFMLSGKKLEPKFDKLNPVTGFTRMFSKQKLVDFFKSLLKILLVGGVAVAVIIPNFIHPDVMMQKDFSVTLHDMHWMLIILLFTFCVAFAFLAIADLLWTRHQHREKLKMTKQEVKDEHKQSDGDPMVKGRIRSLRMRRARERMIKSVPKASVVITNPTHYAVALMYDMDTMPAPKLVAKGVDFLAARIREIAEDNGIPIVENPPLARALYASVDVDRDIPPDHYKAVAEVIGYVMRLRQNGAWRPTPRAQREDSRREETQKRDEGMV